MTTQKPTVKTITNEDLAFDRVTSELPSGTILTIDDPTLWHLERMEELGLLSGTHKMSDTQATRSLLKLLNSDPKPEMLKVRDIPAIEGVITEMVTFRQPDGTEPGTAVDSPDLLVQSEGHEAESA